MNDKARMKAVVQALADTYGIQKLKKKRDPVELLVETILSQNTNDKNRDRAMAALRKALPSWEEVRSARLSQLARLLRPGGLANQKSARIKEILGQIKKERGKIDLRFLKDMPVEEALAYLEKFKGVGQKTSRCVLLFAWGKPVFPVDTHILRVNRRLEFIPRDAGSARAHDILPALMPPERYYDVHLNFIRHGRTVCGARSPQCGACVIKPYCPSGKRF